MKEKLTCCIVDDEPLAIEILGAYIAKVPFVELRGSFRSPIKAAVYLKDEKPDLLFLDINMPDLDGLSFIPMLNPRPMIILTTAYDEFAVKAFELEVKDYLLKPFSFERFYKAVLRVYQHQDVAQPALPTESIPGLHHDSDFLFFKVGHKIQKIAIDDILFIEAMKDYLRIHTKKENVMTLLSFAKMEENLPADKFVRVHRSYMVAIDKINHIEKNRISIADDFIPISDTYSEQFFRRLKGLK